MRALSIALVATVLVCLHSSNAGASCSAPEGPEAHPINNEGDGGTRPFIHLFNVKDSAAVEMFTVDAKCKRDWGSPEKAATPCAPLKGIDFERNGAYLRPKAALPVGTKVQITLAKKLIGDFGIEQQHKDAVANGGITISRRSTLPLQGCQLAGASVDIAVKRVANDSTKYPFQNTLLLVYFKQPNPANPLVNLAHIDSVGPAGDEMSDGRATLRNTSYEAKYMPAKFPAKAWVVFADEDDHLGPVTELTIK